LTTVSSAYRKFLLALLDNATDLLFAARNHCNLSPAWAGQRRFFCYARSLDSADIANFADFARDRNQSWDWRI